MSKTFLTAEWRRLAIANYSIDLKTLMPYIPYGTEPDLKNGICYVSLVGFMFLNTRVKGISIPFHVHFEEVNLRFYVFHKSNEELRRGVVFIKELVPKPAIAWIANVLYHENYESMPMDHEWSNKNGSLFTEYRLKKKKWNTFGVTSDTTPLDIPGESEEEFITEHYWGYTKVSARKTFEYEVQHPRWKVYNVKDYQINVDFREVYGKQFEFLRELKPVSVFLAEGSEIAVKQPKINL